MSTDPLGNRVAESSATGRIDSTGLPPSTAATGVIGVPAVEVVDVANVPLRDRIRWGPIIAGVVTAFAVLLFLTVLGIALGISALGGDDDPQTWGTAAGIWGGLSLLVAFFFGGWMAARAAATLSESDGPLNGFVTGAATLLLLLWLATTAITGALGFFASTVSNIAGAAAPVAMEAVDEGAVPAAAPTEVAGAVENPEAAVPEEVEQAAQQAGETASQAAGPGAWGTTIAIILAIGAATLGGMVGRNERMVLPGSRTVVASR